MRFPKTAQQAADALAGLEVLQGFYQSTGKRFSLHSAAVQLTDAASKLNGHSLAEAVDGFLWGLGILASSRFSHEHALKARQHISPG